MDSVTNVLGTVLGYALYAVPILALAIYFFCGLQVVDQWDRRPMKRFGRYTSTLGPGISWVEPFSTREIDTIDTRDAVDDILARLGISRKSDVSNTGGGVGGQVVQTHDNVPVTFVPLLTYRIVDAAAFVLNVEDDYISLWRRALTIISEFVSNTELDSILHERQNLYERIKPALQQAVSKWGVEIIAVELRDVSIADDSIQEAISMKARAQKEAEAELTRAKMQTQIAQQLKMAAETYDEAAWKLKGFETLTELCRSAQNNTVIIPSDLVQVLAKVAAGK